MFDFWDVRITLRRQKWIVTKAYFARKTVQKSLKCPARITAPKLIPRQFLWCLYVTVPKMTCPKLRINCPKLRCCNVVVLGRMVSFPFSDFQPPPCLGLHLPLPSPITHSLTHTHTGNCEVTVQVPLACYFRPGHKASCAHSDKSVHPLGGSQAKLRFLASPGSNIWPRFPLGTELRNVGLSRGGQFARWVLRLNNGTAFLEHLMVHHQKNAKTQKKTRNVHQATSLFFLSFICWFMSRKTSKLPRIVCPCQTPTKFWERQRKHQNCQECALRKIN